MFHKQFFSMNDSYNLKMNCVNTFNDNCVKHKYLTENYIVESECESFEKI